MDVIRDILIFCLVLIFWFIYESPISKNKEIQFLDIERSRKIVQGMQGHVPHHTRRRSCNLKILAVTYIFSIKNNFKLYIS